MQAQGQLLLQQSRLHVGKPAYEITLQVCSGEVLQVRRLTLYTGCLIESYAIYDLLNEGVLGSHKWIYLRSTLVVRHIKPPAVTLVSFIKESV